MLSPSVFNLAQARLATAFILILILATTSLTLADDFLEGDENIRHLRSGRQLFNLQIYHDPVTVEDKEETCTYINEVSQKVLAQPSVEPITTVHQVASFALLEKLRADVTTKRPIWTSEIVGELDKIVASGGSISCPHYPHSAEDVALAVRKVGMDLKKANVGVISSISPWVEHVLRSEGATHVTTVDYNEPIVCTGIDWIESKSVPEFSTEVGKYDLLVSFSGIEHSGLGRYGDPINPDGDIEAVAQMHKALAPGGFLLLAIPTSGRLYIQGDAHRIYGRDRLVQMIENRFHFLGRVWDGHVFGGWEDEEAVPRLFSTSQEISLATWQFQNVLILRKPRQ